MNKEEIKAKISNYKLLYNFIEQPYITNTFFRENWFIDVIPKKMVTDLDDIIYSYINCNMSEDKFDSELDNFIKQL